MLQKEEEHSETRESKTDNARFKMIQKWRNGLFLMTFLYFAVWLAWGATAEDAGLKALLGYMFLLFSIGLALLAGRFAGLLRGPLDGVIFSILALIPLLNFAVIIWLSVSASRKNAHSGKETVIPGDRASSTNTPETTYQASQTVRKPARTADKPRSTGTILLFLSAMFWVSINGHIAVPLGLLVVVLVLAIRRKPKRAMVAPLLGALLGYLGTGGYLAINHQDNGVTFVAEKKTRLSADLYAQLGLTFGRVNHLPNQDFFIGLHQHNRGVSLAIGLLENNMTWREPSPETGDSSIIRFLNKDYVFQNQATSEGEIRVWSYLPSGATADDWKSGFAMYGVLQPEMSPRDMVDARVEMIKKRREAGDGYASYKGFKLKTGEQFLDFTYSRRLQEHGPALFHFSTLYTEERGWPVIHEYGRRLYLEDNGQAEVSRFIDSVKDNREERFKALRAVAQQVSAMTEAGE